MTECYEEVTFQHDIDRRRSIGDILPTTTTEEAALPGSQWQKAAPWVVAMVTLLGSQCYLDYRSSAAPPVIILPGFGAAPLYRWFGYHRLAR